MELTLRPLGLTELLDRSVTIYRRNFLLFLAIAAAIEVPITLLQVIITLLTFPSNLYAGTSAGVSASLLVYYGGSLVLSIVASIGGAVQMAALSIAVSERYHGRATTLRQVYGRTLRRWDSLLVVLLIVGLANGLVLAVLFGPFFLLTLGGSALGSASVALACLTPLLCLLFIPGAAVLAFLDTRLALTVPAVMLENLKATAGLRRSWNLVSGYFWRVLVTGIALILFVYALMTVPSWLIQFGVLMLGAEGLGLGVMTVIGLVSGTMIGMLIVPIEYAVLTLLYYDLRIRKEGYDLALRARAMGPLPGLTPLELGA